MAEPPAIMALYGSQQMDVALGAPYGANEDRRSLRGVKPMFSIGGFCVSSIEARVSELW